MRLSSLQRNSERSAPAARRRAAASSSRRAGSCPLVESLEGRCLLSTITVTSPSDSGAGSLRAVIAVAESGDTIVFSPSLFSSTSSPKKGNGKGKSQPPPPPAPNTITLTSGDLNLTKHLTIQGPGADQLTISANDASRVFEVFPGVTVVLSGMTITRGWVTYGGGILNNGTLTVTDTTVAGNVASYGGGVYNAGALTVSGGAISGNYADGVAGGGIYNAGGTVAVSNSTLQNNQSRYGGGIYNNGGTTTISGSTISGNYARWDYSARHGYGGGIYNNAGALILSNSIISGNGASQYWGGGGIYNAAAGTITVKNASSITGNASGIDGGVTEDVFNLGVLYLDSTSTIGVLVGNPAILI